MSSSDEQKVDTARAARLFDVRRVIACEGRSPVGLA